MRNSAARCPPSSVYAAFNALPGKKQIINEPLMGHNSAGRTDKANAEAIERRITTKYLMDQYQPKRRWLCSESSGS